MSTRSNIGILNNDGTVTAVYCHWDGYVEYNGRILAEYYPKMERVKRLISGGDLSSLNKEIEPTADHSFEEPQEDVCIYYHRDRGEDWETVKPKTYNSLIELCESLKEGWIEYLYVYIGGDWWYWDIYHNKSISINHLQTELDHIDQQ
jgi:hypothetical protein